MKTFLEFTNTLRGEIWPSGEALTLKPIHTKYFMAAFTDMQKNVPCLRRFNTTTHAKCARHWQDAATVVGQPNGYIRRIFTIANGDWRDQVHYWSSNFHAVTRWQKNLYRAVTPENLGMETLNQGIHHDDGTSDSTVGRARIGIYAIHNRNVYVVPWLQGNETLVIEWDGVKDVWVDADGIDDSWWTVDVQEAVKYYVRWQHELNFADTGLAQQFELKYVQKRGDIMLDCHDKTRQIERYEIPEGATSISAEQITDDVAPTVTTSYSVCLVGDFDRNSNSEAVAAAILTENPRILFTLGDNTYGTSPASVFAQFGISEIKPAWGNHDYDYDSDLSGLTDLFSLSNNERYYEVVDGPVHYFILNSDSREADLSYVDATTSRETSVEGEWLRVKMALSTAYWKVVIVHHAPYTSDSAHGPGAAWMRWPFLTWGANLVLSGHAHNSEFITVGGLLYVTCGLGGHSIRVFGSATSGTISHQYNSDYAFLKLTANCQELEVALIDKSGTEIHSETLEKE